MSAHFYCNARWPQHVYPCFKRGDNGDRRRLVGSSDVVDSTLRSIAHNAFPYAPQLSSSIISRATIGPAFWFCPVTRLPSTTQ